MAKNTTKNTNNTQSTNQDELRKAARGKKASDRSPEEQAAIEAHRTETKARQQAQMTEAITKAVSLNATITSAAALPLAERLEALRDALVSIEIVRAEIADCVRSTAFRASVDVIVNQARDAASSAWVAALEEVRALTAE